MDFKSTIIEPKGRIGQLYGSREQQQRVLTEDPGLHNVLGYELAFADDPQGQDFLSPSSPYFPIKQLATELYWHAFTPYFDGLPTTGHALDLGCGIGRFTVPLARRFVEVTAVDACRTSLQVCRQHLDDAGLTNATLHWADLSWLAELPTALFDVIFAVELLCYATDPAAVMAQLTRLARPGAYLFVSVEQLPGGLCGLPLGRSDYLGELLSGHPLLIEQDRFVTFFDREQTITLIDNKVWQIMKIEPLHYFSEGPFWQLLDDRRLGEPEYRRQIVAGEQKCRDDARTRNLARVLSVVGRKK